MIWESVRSVVGDLRAWVLTAGLLCLHAIGVFVPDGDLAHALGIPAFALMFVYMMTLGWWLSVGLVVDGVPIDFFVGFGLFCFLVATLFVRTYDWVRRQSGGPVPRRESS